MTLPDADPPAGGDPVCWLNRACPECGQFIEDAEVDPETHCPSPQSREPGVLPNQFG
ncbi:hypothetical protein [Amycolatopsis sp. SID8362]|uniref:hypothetical protein n=1 Tax=Amycolatopsis sp. SID8362 TaxID=2690346 RepID=UPI0013721137|nr:hypothetical protein [Amycolatopsis sp. SID8362]NBH04892.1 hypothetical protein [Amycolatopsis sp. SID8362]NED41593.1 hypothetical protein [Amycolatopsis sp. SID8362]